MYGFLDTDHKLPKNPSVPDSPFLPVHPSRR